MGVPFDDPERTTRRFGALKIEERSQSEKDCDRILYSSAFKRLSGVTQVVRSGEADVFHTRQQHTFKVTQIGRRIAQRLSRAQPDAYANLGIDENVVEAACLAHDLGHPPFGHIGEDALNTFSEENNDEGYEGNAQSFRIVCRLAVRETESPGLNLTRATLAALLKYPWLRDRSDTNRTKKWNAYRCDEEFFEFATSLYGKTKTVEAEIMDWADDITYSVHDIEDLHRTNLIPWRSIVENHQSANLVSGALERWHNFPPNGQDRLEKAMRAVNDALASVEDLLKFPYEASKEQRADLRYITSNLIGTYVASLRLNSREDISSGKPLFEIEENHIDQIRILKQINHKYIVDNPNLAAQQEGQRAIIKSLCDKIANSSDKNYPRFLPTRLRYLWDASEKQKTRFTTDCVASLTEQEAVSLNARLCGYASGSVLDPIVR